MSYYNINYSTLEDAWGENFEHKKKTKKKDPVCQLYSQRNNKIHKPYKSVHESTHIKPIYTDENQIKYYGYEDGMPYNMKKKSNDYSKKLSKYKLKFPYSINEEINEEINENVYEERPLAYDSEDELVNNKYFTEEEIQEEYYIPPKKTRSSKLYCQDNREDPLRRISQQPIDFLDEEHSPLRRRRQIVAKKPVKNINPNSAYMRDYSPFSEEHQTVTVPKSKYIFEEQSFKKPLKKNSDYYMRDYSTYSPYNDDTSYTPKKTIKKHQEEPVVRRRNYPKQIIEEEEPVRKRRSVPKHVYEEKPVIRRRNYPKQIIEEEEPIIRRRIPKRTEEEYVPPIIKRKTPQRIEEEAEYVLQFKGILEETQEEDDEMEHSDDELESYMDMRKKPIYEEANYSSEEMSDPEEEYENMLTSVYEEDDEDDYIDEERYYAKKPRQTGLSTLKTQKDTSHLDILLFTISGVLMIFIMEQFVQIGMKMKKETVV